MRRPKNGNAVPAGTGHRVESLTGKVNRPEHSDLRIAAQRRLAMRIVAGAGLSLALATCLVGLALDGGDR